MHQTKHIFLHPTGAKVAHSKLREKSITLLLTDVKSALLSSLTLYHLVNSSIANPFRCRCVNTLEYLINVQHI